MWEPKSPEETAIYITQTHLNHKLMRQKLHLEDDFMLINYIATDEISRLLVTYECHICQYVLYFWHLRMKHDASEL